MAKGAVQMMEAENGESEVLMDIVAAGATAAVDRAVSAEYGAMEVSPVARSDGWLLLNKPAGISSARAVAVVKRALRGREKVGHAGTLDPFATGLLLIGVGRATRLMQYVVGSRKRYEFVAKWGCQTTTDDLTGEPLLRSDSTPSAADIISVIPGFIGDFMQVPPQYSAVSVDGQRAYAVARAGGYIDLKSRCTTVYNLELQEHLPLERSSRFVVECASGFYVRSLVRDLGAALGCYGHAAAIHRTHIGNFSVDKSCDLEYVYSLFDAFNNPKTPVLRLNSLDMALNDSPAFEPSEAQWARLVNGGTFHLLPEQAVFCNRCDSIVLVKREGKLVSVGSISDGLFSPKLVFT